MFNRRTNRNLHMNHCSLQPSQSFPQQLQQTTIQTGSGSSLQSSALNGKASVYRADLSNHVELSPVLFKDAFGDILNEKKKGGIKFIVSVFVVFCKADNEEEITNPPVVLKSDVFVCVNGTDINERLNVACEQIKERIDEFVRNGSGWVIHHLEQMDLGLLKYDPLKASSYIKLPNDLLKKKACVNVHNIDDNKCFLWSVLASLYPVEVHPDRLTNYIPYEREINMQDINYPVKIKDISKFEKQNPRFSVNVFGFEDNKVFPLRITEKESSNHHVNLLLISNDNSTHYEWIKHFSRLFRSQVSSRNKHLWFCYHCLQNFGREDLLEKHVASCRVSEKFKSSNYLKSFIHFHMYIFFDNTDS